jgi:UDP-glucose 4-epimerase
MTVLVTGGAGYVGSHMVIALRDAGRKVVVIDDLSTGFEDAVTSSAVLVEGDVGDVDLVTEVCRQHEVSAVIHMAASVSVPESIERPIDYYINNTGKFSLLLKAVVEAGVRRVILSSTAAVYGIPDQLPITETAALRPETPYGASKAFSERILMDAATAGDLSYAILRYFNVAGADTEGRAGQRTRGATHLIKVAAEAAVGKRPRLEIFGTDYPTADGSCIRDYIHVADLTNAHVLALAHLEQGGQSLLLNCGYGRGYSVREVVAAFEAEIGHPIPVVESPRRDGDVSTVYAASEKLRSTLGWNPRHDDLADVVRSALSFERGSLQ